MRFMATSSGSFLANPRLRKRPAAVSLVNHEAAVSHLTDTAAVGLPTASRQRIGSADFVVAYRQRGGRVPLGGLAVRSWRNASSADPQWGATARFRGVAAKVLHYPTRIWRRLPVLTSCLTLR